MIPALSGLLRPAAVEVFGVTLIGVSERTGVKIAFTLVLLVAVYALRRIALAAARRLPGRRQDGRRFWSRQGIQLASAILVTIGVLSIWLTPGTDLSTGIGLAAAGLALALSQVILALAGYFAILRGDMFTVGDRITIGGVRGDVVQLGFIKTTVFEMGQPPAVQGADPAGVGAQPSADRAACRTRSTGSSGPRGAGSSSQKRKTMSNSALTCRGRSAASSGAPVASVGPLRERSTGKRGAEATEGEHRQSDQRLGRVKAEGAAGDQADGRVCRLHAGVAEPVGQRGEDRLAVGADRGRELHEAGKARALGPGDPCVEHLDRPVDARLVEDDPQLL